MIARLPLRLLAVLLPVVLASCGSDPEIQVLSGDLQAANQQGEALYQKAKSADDAGKTRRAIRLYDKMATEHPSAPSASKARHRQAQLIEQQGRTYDAFNAYDKFIERYPGDRLYPEIIRRQASMANAAAQGDVNSSMLGLKTKLPLEKTIEMLEKVIKHAPKSRYAAKSRFTIGELHHAEKDTKKAVAAFRKLVAEQPDSPEAPEALFRSGVILLEEADRGNQNQANLDLAREAFNDYLLQYPGHPKNADARRMISNLKGRDLQRSLDIADFYLKTGNTESAKVYYRDIVKRSSSGEIRDQAASRLKTLGE
jgi:outer membrane assembly lipoprotein YfiO